MEPENKPADGAAGKGSISKNVLITGLRYSYIGFILPVSVLMGWGLGALADRWLHTSKGAIIGLVLGIIAGFVDLIRVAIKLGKEK